jgi:hypothetical protein
MYRPALGFWMPDRGTFRVDAGGRYKRTVSAGTTADFVKCLFGKL